MYSNKYYYFLKKKNRDIYPILVMCVRISILRNLYSGVLINITVFLKKKKTFFNNPLIIIERYLGLYSICTFVIPGPTPFLFVIYQILSIIYSILFYFIFCHSGDSVHDLINLLG